MCHNYVNSKFTSELMTSKIRRHMLQSRLIIES